nr:MAG TPA: hypothetical protein [Bacteriophage sp.]
MKNNTIYRVNKDKKHNILCCVCSTPVHQV